MGHAVTEATLAQSFLELRLRKVAARDR